MSVLSGCLAGGPAGPGAAPQAQAARCSVAGECDPTPSASAFGRLLAEGAFVAPEVTKARAELNAARANLAAARAARFPTVGLDVAGSAASLALRQPVWAGGRIRSGIAQSEAALHEAEARFLIAQVEAKLRLLDAYGRWLGAVMTVGAIEATAQDYDALSGMIRRRGEAGVSAGAESELVLARRGMLEADLLQARAARDVAKADLDSLLGPKAFEADLDHAALPEGGTALPGRDEVPRLLEGSPYLRLADAGIERARAAVGLARSSRFPVVSVVAEQGLDRSMTGGDWPDPRVFLGVTANLGPGSGTTANIAQSRAELAALEAARAVQARSLGDQVAAALTLHAAAGARQETYRQAIVASQTVLASYRRQMVMVGGKSWQEVLGMVGEISTMRRAEAASGVEKVMAYWKIRILTGGSDPL